MADSTRFLTEADIEEMTRFKNYKKQAEVLRKHGIFFITRRDGSLCLTWHHVNNPVINRDDYEEDNFDWEAIGGSKTQ